MKSLSIFITVIIANITQVSSTFSWGGCPDLNTLQKQENFDMERYLGPWWELYVDPWFWLEWGSTCSKDTNYPTNDPYKHEIVYSRLLNYFPWVRTKFVNF